MDGLRFAPFDTPLGRVAMAWSPRGLYALAMPSEREEETIAWITTSAPGAAREAPPPWAEEVMHLVAAHLGGTPQDFSKVPLDLERVPPFYRAVYLAAQDIPAGQTITYGELATRLGRPRGAARAVGQALAKNPIPIVVPCHRILGAAGAAVGFSAPGGVQTKARLLALEGARVPRIR